MNNLRQRKYLFALLALLLVFAACKGESPTAPPPVSGPGTPGVPPTGATVTITVANPNPITGSSTAITATVTVGGQPVPAGTAVEFGTTLGQFEDTGLATSVRTTNAQGQATVSLTSSAAGTAQVTVVVTNVVQRTTVTFTAGPVAPPPPSATSITGVSPQFGPVEGGTAVTITGTNFRGPVRVFFDLGDGDLREAFVLSVTPTIIQVITPRIELAVGQTLASTVVVFVEQGTPSEQRVTSAPLTFTFRRAQLTPVVRTVSPPSGPVGGGTRVSIFGDAFEFPVQVFFGRAEAQIINATFTQIDVVSPKATDTSDNGSDFVVGTVPLRIVNVPSGTQTTFSDGFRYTAKMVITSAGPTTGPAIGGTRVLIDGMGFEGPVAVSIGGFAAQPISVSGTQVIAITSPTASPCAGGSGDITVTNINNGDNAAGPNFTYIGVNPIIISVSAGGPIQPGTILTVTVLDPGVGALGTAVVRFTIGGQTVIPSPTLITDGAGVHTFTVQVPTTGFTFPTVPCTPPGGAAGSGTQLGPVDAVLTFNNVTTGCTDSITISVLPPDPNLCLTPPSPTVTASPSNAAGCAEPPPASITVAPSSTTATITVSNAANAQPLDVTGMTISGTDANQFSISPTTATGIPAGGNATFTLTFTPTTAGAKVASLAVQTNAPTQPAPLCINATALP